MKYSDIQTSPMKGSRFILLKDVVYKDVTVPEGFVSNGADIPRLFWSYTPPNMTDIIPAVVVHDFLCDIAKNLNDYRKADRYFKEILCLLEIEKHRQFTLSNAVKLYTKTVRTIHF